MAYCSNCGTKIPVGGKFCSTCGVPTTNGNTERKQFVGNIKKCPSCGEETLRIQREEGQYAQHKQTQTANIGAFQVEKQAEVGVAGAEALGQMSANGAGGIDLGGGGDGSGFNPAAMMAGMALGGAVGQNIAGTMNGIMSGTTQPPTNITPPPIPTITYSIAVNGQPTGPFDVSTIKQMVTSGQLSRDNLVWTAGMTTLVRIDSIDEFKSLFMPPISATE